MRFKEYLIIGFTYLERLILFALVGTFLSFVYKFSRTHAIVLIYLNLTYLLCGYTIRVLAKDYLNELTKLLSSKEKTDNGKEEGSTSEGNS